MLQINSTTFVSCLVVCDDTIDDGRVRVIARYPAADAVCEIIADDSVGDRRRSLLAIHSAADAGG